MSQDIVNECKRNKMVRNKGKGEIRPCQHNDTKSDATIWIEQWPSVEVRCHIKTKLRLSQNKTCPWALRFSATIKLFTTMFGGNVADFEFEFEFEVKFEQFFTSQIKAFTWK